MGEFIGDLKRKPGDKATAVAKGKDGKDPPAPDKPEREVALVDQNTGARPQGAQRLVIVALDAGHGGEDPERWPQRLV